MKSLCPVIIFLVLVAFSLADNDSDRMRILKDCKRSEDASENDIQQYLQRKQLRTANSKCFLACVFEKHGAIRDKKIQPVKLRMMLANENEEKNTKQVYDIVDECRAINHLDRCELASQLKNCLDKETVIRQTAKFASNNMDNQRQSSIY